MIPQTKELLFIVRFISVILLASLLSFGVLYFFTDKWVGSDYATAFQMISGVYKGMSYYIAIAVLAQLIISCLLVFFLVLHYSHRIAGPVYRLKLACRQYLNGEVIERVAFRKTDFLHEVAENFTDFFSFHRKKRELFGDAKTLIEVADIHNEKKKQETLMQLKKLSEEL